METWMTNPMSGWDIGMSEYTVPTVQMARLAKQFKLRMHRSAALLQFENQSHRPTNRTETLKPRHHESFEWVQQYNKESEGK